MRKWIIRIVLGLLVTLACVVLLLMVSLQFHQPEARAHTLTVMTWNTHRLGQGKPVGENEVVRYLSEHPADVICLQECEVVKDGSGISLPEFKQVMNELYPYSYYDFKIYNHHRQFGNIVYSRYPLVGKHTIRYESRGNISSCCDIVVDDDTIRLFVNHLESNRLSDADDTEQMTQKMSRASDVRWEQAKTLRRAINDSPYKNIVVGDFNTIALTPTYLYIRQTMQDCYLNGCSWRLGNTCYKHGWGVRIDYILANRSFDVMTSHVDADASGSDHYPVWTTLTW